METFHVRINGGPEQIISVKTGVYSYAALAAPALLGVCSNAPDENIHIEIWVPCLLPEYGPYRYVLATDDFGRPVLHTVAAERKK